MKNKPIRETELYKKLNIHLLDKNKDHLEAVKSKVCFLANEEIDNSALFRGTIEYFYDNPKQLKEIIEYVKTYKGYQLLDTFTKALDQNKSVEEISKETGVGIDIVNNLRNRLNN